MPTFSGVGLGIVAAQSKLVPDEMLLPPRTPSGPNLVEDLQLS
jgi:hypothetical protein